MNIRWIAVALCAVAGIAVAGGTVTYQTLFRVDNGALDWQKPGGSVAVQQLGGPAYAGGVVYVTPTQHVALSMAGVSTQGIVWARNLSTATSGVGAVRLGVDVGGEFLGFAEVGTNEVYWVKLATNSVFARSVAGTNALEYAVFER
jgi:hypothetical protein